MNGTFDFFAFLAIILILMKIRESKLQASKASKQRFFSLLVISSWNNIQHKVVGINLTLEIMKVGLKHL